MRNLRSVRQAKGYSVEQLAVATGVTARYIISLETNGKNGPSLKLAAKISKVLGTPIEEIFLTSK